MSSLEPKYPCEPLPRLNLPANYLYHPLFFDPEGVGSRVTRGAQLHVEHSRTNSPPKVSRRAPCRQLNFSLQEVSDVNDSGAGGPADESSQSGARPRAHHDHHPEGRRRLADSGSTSPQNRTRSASASTLSRATTRSVQLRERYLLQRARERLEEEEERRWQELAAEVREPPAPPEDDVDERMLRPTRAAQLRSEFVARKRYSEEETQNNIFFLKGQDTSRGSPSYLNRGSTVEEPEPQPRLTKAAQLLRERTMRRLEELQELQERRRQEEEGTGTSALEKRATSLAAAVEGRGGEHMRGSLPESSRQNRAEELRRQYIAERTDALESERAKEQAARDAILRGPRGARRTNVETASKVDSNSAMPATRTNSGGAAPSRVPGPLRAALTVPVQSHKLGPHRERQVASVHLPSHSRARGATAGLSGASDSRRPALAASAAAAAPVRKQGAELSSSSSSSSASSVLFHVEVLPQGKDVERVEGRTLGRAHGGTAVVEEGGRTDGSPCTGRISAQRLLDESRGAADFTEGSEDDPPTARLMASQLPPSGAPSNSKRRAEVPAARTECTPAALPTPRGPQRETTQHRHSDEAVTQTGRSTASLASLSTVDTVTVDPSRAQAELLRRMRDRLTASSPSADPSHIRVPVLFTADSGGPRGRPQRTGSGATAGEPYPLANAQEQLAVSAPAAQTAAHPRAAMGGTLVRPQQAKELRINYISLADCRTLRIRLERQLLRRYLAQWVRLQRRKRQVSRLEASSTPVLSTVASALERPRSPMSMPGTSGLLQQPSMTHSGELPLTFANFANGIGDECCVGAGPDPQRSRGGLQECTSRAPPPTHTHLRPRTPVESTLIPELQESRSRNGDTSATAMLITSAATPPEPRAAHSSSGMRHCARVDQKVSTGVRSRPAVQYTDQESSTSKAATALAPTAGATTSLVSVSARLGDRSLEQPTLLSLEGEPPRTASPPCDVGRRESVHHTRKAPKEYSPPPSDLLRTKGTQTPADRSAVDVSATTGTTDGSPSQPLGVTMKSPPRLQPAPSATPKAAPAPPVSNTTSTAAAVASDGPAPPSTQAAAPSGGGAGSPQSAPVQRVVERNVSVRPRGTWAGATRTRPTQWAATPLQRAPPPSTAPPVAPAAAVGGNCSGEEPSTAVPAEVEAVARPTGLGAPGALMDSRASTPIAHPPSPPLLAASFREREPGGVHTSLVPELDEVLVGASRRSPVLEGGRPGSHAPTPARTADNAQLTAQSSPPPRPSHRAASSDLAGGARDGSAGPVRLVLPELSLPRSESGSLQRPAPRLCRAVAEAAALRSSSPVFSTTSSSFRASSGSQPLSPEAHQRPGQSADSPGDASPPTLPPMHTGEGHAGAAEDASAARPPTAEAAAPRESCPPLHVDPHGASSGGCGEGPVHRLDPSASTSCPASTGEGAVLPKHDGGSDDGGVADVPLSLDERPAAPVPLFARSSESLGGRTTGITAWSMGSTYERPPLAASPAQSEQGGPEELVSAFGPRSPSLPNSPPMKPRYYHGEF